MTVATWVRDDTREQLDLLLLVLLLVGVLCLPLTIETIELVPEGARLIGTSLLAAVIGVLLARSAAPTWLAWVLGIVLGLEYSLNFAGRLFPSLGLVLGNLGRAVSWLWNLATTQTLASPLPFARTIGYLSAQTGQMASNVTAWLAAMQAGEPSHDNTMLWFASALIVWLLCFNAGLELFRRRRTFVAMLPLGAIVVACVSFTYVGMAYVHVFLGITLLTLVRANVKRMEAFWARMRMDFSPELRRDATIVGSILSTVVLVIALVTPYLTYGRVVWAFWEWVRPHVTGFYQDLDRAFAGRNPVPEPTKGIGGLPAHNVAGGGVLGEDTVFMVTISDPAPPPAAVLEIIEMEMGDIQSYVPKRYWRERTYDVYTGHGWDSSARNPAEQAAGKGWAELDFPGTVVTQTYTLANRRAPFGFAINELVNADRAYQVVTRGAGDLAAFRVSGGEYTVVSRAPEPTVDQMRAAEAAYPDWVATRFLDLPSIPGRVEGLAQQIVSEANATTRYDKALAIEHYIRSLPYDLTVEPPSLDADIVEYFLFDVKKGYCDYSATAMTVMLRAVGVAARYASGYSMGVYNEDVGAYVVTQANSHAWTEVYFPGLGWVEFEPTPAQ
ncbi:MAG: transglutaminase domain-containing protein, partial [Chloroflexota bacterium]